MVQLCTKDSLCWMKEKSIGGCNFTCTKTRKTTTRSQDFAWSPTLKCTQHSLTLQEMQLGMPSRSLVINSSAECSTTKMTLEKKRSIPKNLRLPTNNQGET